MVIRYKFLDGTVQEIEVSDELWEQSEILRRAEANNNHKETRRHNSYDQEVEQGRGIADDMFPAPGEQLLLQEEYTAVRAAFDRLSERDKRLLRMRADERLTIDRIAAIEGVSINAISKRLIRIQKKLCKVLD